MTQANESDNDAPARDENGLTRDERQVWLSQYTAISTMLQTAVTSAPTRAEAIRRLKILRLEHSIVEAAIQITTDEHWKGK